MPDLFATPPMLLSEYIKKLQVLLESEGADAQVQKWLPSKGRHHAPDPVVAYTRQVTTAFGSKVPMGFWSPQDDPAEKGVKVIRV